MPRHSSYEEEYISSYDRAEREAVYEGVASRLHNPVNQTWSQHWPGVNHLVRFSVWNIVAAKMRHEAGPIELIKVSL